MKNIILGDIPIIKKSYEIKNGSLKINKKLDKANSDKLKKKQKYLPFRETRTFKSENSLETQEITIIHQ